VSPETVEVERVKVKGLLLFWRTSINGLSLKNSIAEFHQDYSRKVFGKCSIVEGWRIQHIRIISVVLSRPLRIRGSGKQCLQARRQQGALAGRYIYVSQSSLLFNGLFASDGPTSLLNASFVLFGFVPEVIRAEFFGCYGFVPFQTSCGVLGIFL